MRSNIGYGIGGGCYYVALRAFKFRIPENAWAVVAVGYVFNFTLEKYIDKNILCPMLGINYASRIIVLDMCTKK